MAALTAMTRSTDRAPDDDAWKRARDRKALRQAAERMQRRDRERREELAQRLDEWGGDAEREPVPRVD